MEYLNRDELTRMMSVAKEENHMHWQLMLTAFYFGLRVSEVVNILGEDVQDGQLAVKRLKGSNKTLQAIPAGDGSSDAFRLDLIERAASVGPRGRLFPVSRQRVDQFVKRYARLAGIHRSKAHLHAVGKHSIAMAIWKSTQQLGQIKAYLGHKSMSSTMVYLNEDSSQQATAAVAALGF
jgi:site-specific recombinase XerD